MEMTQSLNGSKRNVIHKPSKVGEYAQTAQNFKIRTNCASFVEGTQDILRQYASPS